MQKSLCFHVCVNKKGLMHHVITPRTLLDAHGLREVSERKQYALTTHRKFFTTLKANAVSHLHAVFALLCCFSEVNDSWRGIKMQK